MKDWLFPPVIREQVKDDYSPIQQSIGSSRQCKKPRKEIKTYKLKMIKLSLFTDDIIMYKEKMPPNL